MRALIQHLPFATIAVTTFSLMSCAENPADGVEKAVVTDKSVKSGVAAAKQDNSIQKQTFVITETSKIEFVGSNVTKTQPGGFSNFVGKFEVAGDKLAAGGSHNVSIDMTSVFTNSDKLTQHLIGEDFFDAKKFPTARFELKEAISKGDDLYQLNGTLDLHGVAKKISFPASVKVAEGQKLAKISAEFSINRKDFEIVYPGKPDDLIRDEVVIKLDLAAIPGEPRDLRIGIGGEPLKEEVAETREERPEGERRGGPGRPDWRNMSPEEREEARKNFIASIDKNKDGNLGKDEVSERMWSFISRADKNGDDMVSEAEGKDHRAEREAERAVRELLGEDAPDRGPGGGRPGGRRPPENSDN